MAKFIYKMQNILDVKYKLETQAKTEYSLAANKVREEKKKLAELRNRKAAYENKLRKLMNSTLDILEINLVRQGIKNIEEAIKKQLVTVKVAEMNLEQARIKLSKVMVDRKTHEKLKENAFTEFVKELGVQESKEIDELVSYSYNKGSN